MNDHLKIDINRSSGRSQLFQSQYHMKITIVQISQEANTEMSSGQFIHRCLDMDEAQKHTREMSQPCEYDATPFNNYHYASQYSG